MFRTISIKKFEPKFNRLSVNLLNYFDHLPIGPQGRQLYIVPRPPPLENEENNFFALRGYTPDVVHIKKIWGVFSH